MENINFFTFLIENKYINGIYSVVLNLNHGIEPNSSQDFDIHRLPYVFATKKTNFCLKRLKKHAKILQKFVKI